MKVRLEELDPEGRPSFGRAAPERRDWDSAGPRQPTWTLYSDRRTPMRDEIQTPLRVSTPLRTPSRDGAWDPMQPMTPLRPETPIYDSWTPATAESSYNPITPGYQSYSSPYTPAASAVPTTPTPSEPASAAYNPTTPTATAETPGYHPETSTPGSAEHYTSTPGYSTATIPTTPGIPATPAAPSTPGAPSHDGSAYDDSAVESEDNDWHVPNIQVKIISSEFRGGRYLNSIAVIKEVLPDGSNLNVHLSSRNEFLTIAKDLVEPFAPEKKGSHIMILKGEQRGEVGTLIGIDGKDGIVKLDSNGDIKILQMSYLAQVGTAP